MDRSGRCRGHRRVSAGRPSGKWEARGARGGPRRWRASRSGWPIIATTIESLLVKETGKSAADAAQEVPLLLMILSYYIKIMDKALAPETRPASLPLLAMKKVTVHFRPVV